MQEGQWSLWWSDSYTVRRLYNCIALSLLIQSSNNKSVCCCAEDSLELSRGTPWKSPRYRLGNTTRCQKSSAWWALCQVFTAQSDNDMVLLSSELSAREQNGELVESRWVFVCCLPPAFSTGDSTRKPAVWCMMWHQPWQRGRLK